MNLKWFTKNQTSKVGLSASGAHVKVGKVLEIAAYVLPEGETFRCKEKKVTLVVKYAPEEDDLFNSSEVPLGPMVMHGTRASSHHAR